MNWLNDQQLKWQDPLAFAQRFPTHDIALLYSGMREQGSGTFSYLCIDPIEVITGSNWTSLDAALKTSPPSPLPDWIGYLGYGMRDSAARASKGPTDFPDMRLLRYAHLFRFNHMQHTIDYFRREGRAPLVFTDPVLICAIPVSNSKKIRHFASNFTRKTYETSVAETIAHIHAGDFYQANITRKFFGEFATAPDSLALFQTLCEVSPAPYSAYIRHAGTAILSASPEGFLRVDTDGTITARPIKGSARRDPDPARDAIIQRELLASAKNQAENLMIVDLMRNDLARVSEPQSVQVQAQSALHSYSTIHHLISTITAKKRSTATLADTVRACFPPGSMTGAPKLAAIDWCTAQEKRERGVYSGAIGWISGDSCDLSVVIRTLLIDGTRFEFQVGGGIVADSTPDDEWRETIAKARGILATLGISEKEMVAL